MPGACHSGRKPKAGKGGCPALRRPALPPACTPSRGRGRDREQQRIKKQRKHRIAGNERRRTMVSAARGRLLNRDAGEDLSSGCRGGNVCPRSAGGSRPCRPLQHAGGGRLVWSSLTSSAGRPTEVAAVWVKTPSARRAADRTFNRDSAPGTIRCRAWRRCTTIGGGGAASRQLGRPAGLPDAAIRASRSTGLAAARVATSTRASPAITCRGRPAIAGRVRLAGRSDIASESKQSACRGRWHQPLTRFCSKSSNYMRTGAPVRGPQPP